MTFRLMIPGLLLLVALLPAVPAATAQKPLKQVQPQPTEQQRRNRELFRMARLARQAESDGDYPRALDLWRAVWEGRPGDRSAYSGTQRCLNRLGRFNEALKFLEGVDSLARSGQSTIDPVQVAADRVELLFAAGRNDSALADAEAVIQEFKGLPDIYSELARVFFADRMNDRALELLERGRRECGDPHLFARDIASYAEVVMDWGTAVSEYLLYLEDQPRRLSYVTGAIADFPPGSGADSVAVAVIERRIGETADRELRMTYRRLLASLHFRARRYSRALEQYRLLDLSGGEAKALLQFAAQLESEGEYRLARQAYAEVREKSSDRESVGRALLGMGRAAQASGLPDTAHVDYLAVAQGRFKPPLLFEAFSRLGMLTLEVGGAPAEARGWFLKALKTTRGAGISQEAADEIRVQAALTWAREGNFKRAGKELTAVVGELRQRSEATSHALLELARLHFQEGDFEQCRKRALTLAGLNPASNYTNEALDYIALLNDFKDNPALLRALGREERAMFSDDLELAGAMLDSLSTAGPTGREAEEIHWRRFRLELRRGDPEAALVELEAVVALGAAALKGDLALLQAGTIALKDLGEADRAAGFWERLLMDYPDSPLAERARKRLKVLQPQT